MTWNEFKYWVDSKLTEEQKNYDVDKIEGDCIALNLRGVVVNIDDSDETIGVY